MLVFMLCGCCLAKGLMLVVIVAGIVGEGLAVAIVGVGDGRDSTLVNDDCNGRVVMVMVG